MSQESLPVPERTTQEIPRQATEEEGDSNRVARLRSLVESTLFHDTYCPLILSYCEPKEVFSSIIFVSKFHHNLVCDHPQSISLCRTLISQDFGPFITDSPLAKHFQNNPKIKSGQDLINMLYLHLPSFLYEHTRGTWLSSSLANKAHIGETLTLLFFSNRNQLQKKKFEKNTNRRNTFHFHLWRKHHEWFKLLDRQIEK